MSENKHTPEPWEWSKHRFNSPPFEGTLEQECGIYPPLGESGPVAIASGEDNARRIVACVNACAGIRTEQLENAVIGKALVGSSIQMWMAYTDKKAELEDAIEQRDELLAALEKYLTVMAQCGGGDKQLFMAAIREADDKARAVIASVKGGAA